MLVTHYFNSSVVVDEMFFAELSSPLNRKILSKKLKLKQQANVNSDSEEDKENTTTIDSTNNTTEKRKKFSKKKNSDKAADTLTEKSGQLCNLCQTKFSSEAHLKQHFISVHQQR